MILFFGLFFSHLLCEKCLNVPNISVNNGDKLKTRFSKFIKNSSKKIFFERNIVLEFFLN